MPDLVDILDRVRKLLALATSPNVHEAAAAAARAQALISRHHLEQLVAGEPDPDPVTDGAEAPLERARKLRKWRVVLAAGLCDVNGCVAYTVDLGREQELRVVGRSADRAMVQALWAWLPERLQWLSATHGAGRSRSWHDDFRIGAVDAVIEALRAAAGDAHGEVSAGALVPLDPLLTERAAAVDRFVAEHLRLGRGRGLRVDPRAWARGREAGRTVPLPARSD
jgi:hypothetical protein